MNSSNPWKKRLEQVPELEPYLRRIALKWAKGNPLPKRTILGPEPKEPSVRAAIDRIFGGRVFYRNGKLTVEIPAVLRKETELAALADALNIEKESGKQTTNPIEMIQRLRLSHPQVNTEWLQNAPEIARMLNAQPEQEQLLHQLLKTAAFLQTQETPITLSKLGSMFFNDSKILRSGTPRKLLGGIVNARLGTEDSPENREIALQQFNVIDNPATTLVTIFGPLDLVRNKRPDQWLADRFQAGEPVTLNSYNLQDIDSIKLYPGFDTIITSENAAPFHELVSDQPNSILLYTGGYPNACVCRLLHLFSEAGATCLHWGDTDPDGFMIADLILRRIPTTLYRCGIEEVVRHSQELKPLSEQQLRRGEQLLKTRPDFPFRTELAFSLESRSWLEQEKFQTLETR
jgi:hypothetical protein